MAPRNRYAEAFKENFNVLGLAGAVALAAATLNPLILIPALVLEAAYLIFVPDSRWYSSRLSKLHDADIAAQRAKIKAQVLPTLRPQLQQRFTRLEEVRRQIGTIARDEETWFREVLRKLDYLLDKYLQFAGKEAQFRNYLQSILAEARGEMPAPGNSKTSAHNSRAAQRGSWLDDAFDPQSLRRGQKPQSAPGPAGAPRRGPGKLRDEAPDQWVRETVAEAQKYYDHDLQELQTCLQNEKDTGTRAVLEKRIEVLKRRRDFVDRIGRILLNLNHQLELLEDTFGLISDEIRARPPEQVLADIEDVVSQTNTMTQVLEEMAPYEQSLARMMN
jgi:hypothetical protein